LRAHLARLNPEEHALVLTIHHIVCDGHSWGIILRQLEEFYAAACRNEPHEPPVPLQLGAYALAHQGAAESEESRAAEAWWQAQFAGGVPALELPTDHPRPAVMTFAGARENRVIGAELRGKLRELAARQGSTLFTTLLAAYYVWLMRLAGEEEMVVGVPVAERAQPGAETLVAHCVALLPVRVRVDSGEPFTRLQARVQRAFLDAHEHRQCGLGRIIGALGLPRDTSRQPLAAVTFNVDRLREPLRFAGLETALSSNAHSPTNFDLSLNVTEIGDELLLECHYYSALFEAEAIRRWLGHFETLLGGIVAAPEKDAGDLPLLSVEEEKRLLVEWNDTRAGFPKVCAHNLFEEQAERTPDATALVCGEDRLSYRALNERADRLADHLRRLGVGPDRLVAVCLERTPELVVAILAVLKAGGAYVPLDPAYPPDRLAFIVADSRATVTLTLEKFLPALPTGNATVLCLDRPWPRVPRGRSAAVAAGPHHLAYVLHTSGSTGRPKGVAVEHRGVVALVAWARQFWRPEDLRGVLASTSVCFDLSVFEIFVPLAAGGMIVLAENALALPALPAAPEVTLINTVPSAIAELLRLEAIPASVRVINLAGEPLAQELVERLHRMPGKRRVFDLYGPTEDTVYSTCALRQSGGRATIGRPIANKQAHILDARLRPVPIGVEGELFLGGVGLARGYLGQPELTAEKFVPNPFQPGARLYRTGDRARRLPDGDIEFLGRRDQQVKLRGFRVELGEIETALRGHPFVREAAAAVWTRDDQQLAAYVVPANGAGVDAAELRRHLRAQLPEHMVPAVFMPLAGLPRTPNGKLDRRALPPPETKDDGPREDFTPPGTPTEEALVEIWRELLRQKRVGTRDNFFDLGGHSLLATRFVARVREAFQVELPLRSLFQTPTIAALAPAVEELVRAHIDAMSEEEAGQLAVGR